MVDLNVGLRCKLNFALVLKLPHNLYELLILDLLHTLKHKFGKCGEARLEARGSL